MWPKARNSPWKVYSRKTGESQQEERAWPALLPPLSSQLGGSLQGSRPALQPVRSSSPATPEGESRVDASPKLHLQKTVTVWPVWELHKEFHSQGICLFHLTQSLLFGVNSILGSIFWCHSYFRQWDPLALIRSWPKKHGRKKWGVRCLGGLENFFLVSGGSEGCTCVGLRPCPGLCTGPRHCEVSGLVS